MELRALCNEVPRTPPGPEGSNGTGYASGAADHPKFLSLKSLESSVFGYQSGFLEKVEPKFPVISEERSFDSQIPRVGSVQFAGQQTDN